MDGVGPRRVHNRGSHAQHRPVQRTHQTASTKKDRHAGEKYWLVRSIGKIASKRRQTLWARFQQTEFARWPDKSMLRRLYAWLVFALFIVSTVVAILQPLINISPYRLTTASRAIIPRPNENLATSLKFKDKEQVFAYNEGYQPSTSANSLKASGNGNPRISAMFAKDPTKGVTLTDPVNKVDFTLKPKYQLAEGKQDKNQVMYALSKTDGFLVYTAQIASVKEDIVLQRVPDKDKMIFEYELGLGNDFEAKIEKDGSVGVYGSSLPLYGNVATGSDKDAELLQKTKQNAKKDKFLYGIPAPIVKESGKKVSGVQTHFELQGSTLKVVSERLKQASYPLTIDPSIFIQSAAQLMYGNNETNVEFDIATEQFKKGTTTGARIDQWTDVGNMNDSAYGEGVATSGGYVYRAGGSSGSKIMPYIADQTITTNSTAVNPVVLNMPSYRPTGDLYVAIIGISGATITTPSGWTAFSTLSSTKLGAFYHYSTGTEPASYSFTTSATQKYGAVILRIKNFDTSSIVNTSSTGVNNQTGTTSMTYPTLTPSAQGTLVIAMDGFQSDPVNANGYSPSGWSDVVAAHSSNTTGDTTQAGIMASALYSPPLSGTATGTQTMTAAQTGHTTGNFTSAAIAINGITTTAANNQTVQWSHFNSSTGSISSPAPGSNAVACSNWCTDTSYNLPSGIGTTDGAGNVGAAMVAYNGYLYYIGGSDGTNIKSTIYIAKLGANGEPSLWHPTNPSQASWVYWYKDAGIYSATALNYTSAYAYNGKMYLVGGDTDTTNHSGATATVKYADILPNGTLGTWTSGTSLPTAAWGVSLQGYNGYLYAIGGITSGTTTALSTVNYTHLNADGSMNSWQTAVVDGSTFSTGRAQLGGQMSGVWGGYIYLAGGCATLDTTTDYCSSIPQTVQLASINSDGSLDIWNTMVGIYNQRFGSSFVAWQDNLYRFGGCSRQDTSTGACYGTHMGVQYGTINQDGDASTVSISQASGSGNCIDPDPYDCNLPTGEGQMLTNVVILNGYIYVIGGCNTAACTTAGNMSGDTVYAAIDSSGRLKSPPTCSGTTSGAWCIDATNVITGGVGAAGVAVFNKTMYLVGGQNGNSGAVNKLFRNTVNADGSLTGAWGSQNLSSGTPNVGATNVSFTYAYARANPSSASTVPGNLYIFGGCSSPATGAGCASNAETQDVYKCQIMANGSIGDNSGSNGSVCTKTGQLQIGTVTGASAAGLGVHAGTVYANYIYLIGGLAPNLLDLKQVRYAKFDNNNNVVAVSGSAWIESPVNMLHGRRRGTAFGYNGYIYAVGGYDSNSSQILDTIEFAKINVTDGSIVNPGNSQFTQSAVTFNQRWGLGMAVSNSYAYIIGGCKVGASPNCTTLDPTVQTFQLYNNDSGAPGGYSKASNLYATDRIGAGAAILNGYMYIAGGCTGGTDCTSPTTDVQMAQIDANGTVGAWTTTSIAALPAARAYGQLEVAGNDLYYIGGQDATPTTQSTIYYATMGSNGTISAWTAATKGIGDTGSGGQARTQASTTVWNNRIYVTGGNNASGTAQNTVLVSPQLNSGGDITSNWTSTTGFSIARNGHTVVAYANNLYIIGGFDNTNYLSDVQFAQIGSNGTVGSWTYTTNLPYGLRQADGFAANGYMYLFGGRTSTNDCTDRTLIVPISANTSIASGNNPTGIGEWYQTNRNFDGGRYAAAAVNYQGKAYVVGGGCQGIVMQDDFDDVSSPYYDATQWTSIANMQADFKCQSTSSSRTLSGTVGGTGGTSAIATSKSVNVSSGGTVFFKLYEPLADTGTCYKGESTTSLLTTLQDNVELQYSLSPYSTWTTVGSAYVYNQQDPFKSYAATIPAGAFSTTTKFRWLMPNGGATDSFALEDEYIIATGNTSISYPADRVAQTPLLSQPQIAVYSRLVDAGNDAFPKKFLMNGIDNSIGARWQMNYRSMNDPTNTANPCGGSVMTGYGALTNFGDVTLGTPGTYTMKDGSATDIGCGRYFFMTVSIDASQTYGYPDDITRGPTLDNLTLFYNSNPGKRLIHGKTFTEGIQQPLDTQP